MFVVGGIVAFAVFLLIKAMNTLRDRLGADTPEPAATKVCPFCCSDIPAYAVKCPHCTADLNNNNL